jgi:hypothetical protein
MKASHSVWAVVPADVQTEVEILTPFSDALFRHVAYVTGYAVHLLLVNVYCSIATKGNVLQVGRRAVRNYLFLG